MNRILKSLMRGSIIIVCGKPASGKTTYIKKALDKLGYMLSEEDIKYSGNLMFKKQYTLKKIEELPKNLNKNCIYESDNILNNSIIIEYPKKEEKIKYLNNFFKDIDKNLSKNLIENDLSTFDFVSSCYSEYFQEKFILTNENVYKINNPDFRVKDLIDYHILKKNNLKGMFKMIKIYDKFRFNTNYNDLLYLKMVK